MVGMEESDLIAMAKAGDLTAFNRLIPTYQSLVFNVARRILGDPAAAEDAAQEAFISAYKGLRRFRGGSFRAWLMRIVTNACYDELRRQKRRPQTPLEELNPLDEPGEVDHAGVLPAEIEGPEAAAERSALASALEDCLQQLPPEFRSVALLVDVEGFDYREASQSIGRPVGTIKSRLARARQRMQECLQGYRELLPVEMRLETES